MMSSPLEELNDWPEPKPRVASWDPFVDRPGRVDSLFEEAQDLWATAGLELDPWELMVLRIWLGGRPENPDKWAHRRSGLIVSRQNGKGVCLEARELVSLHLLTNDPLIVHSAHEFKTAEEAFERLATIHEDSPLRKQLKPGGARPGVKTGRGQESIRLKNGRRIRYVSRSRRSVRGFTDVGLLVWDEAMMQLKPEAVGAAAPTMNASVNPQSIYTATAGNDESEVLAELRSQGIEGRERLAYVEYAAGETDDHTGENVDLDDMAEAYRANPAMHVVNPETGEPRISEETILDLREELDEEQFAREILGIWWQGKRVSIIDPDHWQDRATDSEWTGETALAFAVDMPPERDRASIGVAASMPDGSKIWELVAHQKGTKWATAELVRLAKKHKPAWVAVAPNSPAGSLIDEVAVELEDAKIPVYRVQGVEVKAACGLFLDDVTEEQASWYDGEYGHVLASAVDALRKREFPEGGFVFHRRDTAADISPVMALALASYALGKPAKKKQYSGKAVY